MNRQVSAQMLVFGRALTLAGVVVAFSALVACQARVGNKLSQSEISDCVWPYWFGDVDGSTRFWCQRETGRAWGLYTPEVDAAGNVLSANLVLEIPEKFEHVGWVRQPGSVLTVFVDANRDTFLFADGMNRAIREVKFENPFGVPLFSYVGQDYQPIRAHPGFTSLETNPFEACMAAAERRSDGKAIRFIYFDLRPFLARENEISLRPVLRELNGELIADDAFRADSEIVCSRDEQRPVVYFVTPESRSERIPQDLRKGARAFRVDLANGESTIVGQALSGTYESIRRQPFDDGLTLYFVAMKQLQVLQNSGTLKSLDMQSVGRPISFSANGQRLVARRSLSHFEVVEDAERRLASSSEQMVCATIDGNRLVETKSVMIDDGWRIDSFISFWAADQRVVLANKSVEPNQFKVLDCE